MKYRCGPQKHYRRGKEEVCEVALFPEEPSKAPRLKLIVPIEMKDQFPARSEHEESALPKKYLSK